VCNNVTDENGQKLTFAILSIPRGLQFLILVDGNQTEIDSTGLLANKKLIL
jgi:hypothetical protein